MRAGQAGGELDLHEGGRGGLHRARQDRAPPRRRRRGDGVRRAGPGRHARAQDHDLQARLRHPGQPGRLPARGHHLRSQHLRHRHRHGRAQRLRRRLHRGHALDQAEPAARARVGRRVEPVVLVPRQRAGARGHAFGVSLPRHQGRHGHGHRQCRADGGLRRSRSRIARGLRGRGAQPPAGCVGTAAGAGAALPRRRRRGEEGSRSRLARMAGGQAAVARAGAWPHRLHRDRCRRGAAAGGAPAARDRRPADGRHERRRRSVRLRQDVPAAGGEVGARDEAGGRLPDAVHGEGEGSAAGGRRRGRAQLQRQDRDGDRQGRRARHRQEHRRRRAPVQQLRGRRSRRHGAGRENPRDRAGGEGRHHRAVGPDHAVARRDVPCRRRDGAPGL